MLSPCCGVLSTCIDSRDVKKTRQVRRRRVCGKCKERYTTYESTTLFIAHGNIRTKLKRAMRDLDKVLSFIRDYGGPI